jgi:chromosome segregation ATPase
MSDAEVDQEQLIKELIAESFALRTKSEHLSQYVETRIADLVKTRSELSTIKGESEREIGQLKSESEREIGRLKSESELEIRRLRAGIETANQQRNELQDKLDSLLSEHEALGEANLQMTSQRDRLRDRMAQVDSSPEYRLAKRLRRILGVVLKDVPTQ